MKQLKELSWRQLPEYECEGLFQRLRSAASEHGYRSAFVYGLARYKDFLLGVWSRTAPWNGTRIRMQRARGVQIGKKVHFGTDVVIENLYPNYVVIEDGAALAGNDYILTHTKASAYHDRCSESFVAPVFVRRNAWVAVNVTLLPGVEIGEGAIVSAGSVVSKDVPPMTVVSGNPAKVVADIAQLVKKNYSPEEFASLRAARKEKFGI